MSKVDEFMEIYESTFTDSAAIYLGSLTNLVKVNDLLRWRNDEEMAAGLQRTECKVLTLAEIANQLPSGQQITVIVSAPLHGEIYQYGNYRDGIWHQIGSTQGYE